MKDTTWKAAFPELFNVGKTDLDHHIGRRVYCIMQYTKEAQIKVGGHLVKRKAFFNEETGEFGYLDIPQVFIIESIQRTHDGTLAFRIYEVDNEWGSFGRVARPDGVVPVLALVGGSNDHSDT